MKRLLFYFLISIVAFFIGIFAARVLILLETNITHTEEIVVLTEHPFATDEVEAHRNTQRYSMNTSAFESVEPGYVKFKNISFRYDPMTFSQIEVEEILEDSPVELERDKPGENFPTHTVFYLKWGERKAIIRVIPITEYRRMYAISENYTKIFDEQLEGIRKASRNARFRLNEQLPFIPFYDGGQEFQDKVKLFSFQNGRGFFFLTQYTFEPTIINNDGLTYYYQGISDNKYYILGDFPVSAPFLPNDHNRNSFEDYEIPEYFYRSESHASNAKEYNQYIRKMAQRLEKLPGDKFLPDLTKIQDVIASLRIEK